jgi:hypothetical protein
MKRFALIVGMSGVMAAGGGAAWAQSVGPVVGEPGNPDTTIVQGAGVKVGEGTVMHPSAGVETGFISNVFYTNDNPDRAGLLRALVELDFASLSGQRLSANAGASGGEGDPSQDVGDLQWRGGLRLVGEEYLGGNASVQAQHNVAWGASLHGLVFPRKTWEFGFDDDYTRDTRPTNFESRSNLDRDINRLQLTLHYRPIDRALSGALRYQNVIDVFEASSQAFSNRIQHTIGARVNWQWLPITKVYVDGSIGIFGPLGTSSIKTSSLPLRVLLGLQTAITVNTTIDARVGYGNSFYASGESFNNVIAGVQFGWRFSPLSKLSALYTYDFDDSIQANYFRDHRFQLGLQHQYDRFTAVAAVDVRIRGYRSVFSNVMGPPDRNDLILGLTAGARYNFKDWLAATADYELTVDSTGYSYMAGGVAVDPSYIRHQLMAGVRATW